MTHSEFLSHNLYVVGMKDAAFYSNTFISLYIH